MTEPPEFRDLVGDDLPAEERERLARVHELLLEAGPPPELPPSLRGAPDTGPVVEHPSWLLRRRVGAGFALAAAIALIAFVGGYIVGYEKNNGDFDAARNVVLQTGPTRVVVALAAPDSNGNRRMLVSARGLPQTARNNYYIIGMKKDGRRLVQCGTFKVGNEPLTTVRFTVGYQVEGFDRIVVAEYRHSDHSTRELLTEKLKL
jgi:hypothetical protein